MTSTPLIDRPDLKKNHLLDLFVVGSLEQTVPKIVAHTLNYGLKRQGLLPRKLDVTELDSALGACEELPTDDLLNLITSEGREERYVLEWAIAACYVLDKRCPLFKYQAATSVLKPKAA
ncbi:MAG: hypothetical protein H7Y42_13990 [Chitinophagaceae bacterium]|nr:hypothetical protein [Chitinophagaceae bacterium]